MRNTCKGERGQEPVSLCVIEVSARRQPRRHVLVVLLSVLVLAVCSDGLARGAEPPSCEPLELTSLPSTEPHEVRVGVTVPPLFKRLDLPGNAFHVRQGEVDLPATARRVAPADMTVVLVLAAGSSTGQAAQQQALGAVVELLLRLPSGVRVALASGAGSPRVLAALSSNRADVIRVLAALGPETGSPEGAAAAVRLGLAELPPGTFGHVILFTDAPNPGIERALPGRPDVDLLPISYGRPTPLTAKPGSCPSPGSPVAAVDDALARLSGRYLLQFRGSSDAETRVLLNYDGHQVSGLLQPGDNPSSVPLGAAKSTRANLALRATTLLAAAVVLLLLVLAWLAPTPFEEGVTSRVRRLQPSSRRSPDSASVSAGEGRRARRRGPFRR